MHKKSILEALKGRNSFEDLGMDDRLLKWIFKNMMQGSGLAL
jgi:hypothetical protein